MNTENVSIYCVRAAFGKYADHFVNGNYIAIGWLSNHDLAKISNREEIYSLYKNEHPDDSNLVTGQQVGQIARFLFEIKAGDYVITPAQNTELIYYGVVEGNAYFYADESDGCTFRHRKRVKWHKTPIQRSRFSVPFQNTIRSSLTVFYVGHQNNFFTTIEKPEFIPQAEKKNEFDYYDSVLNRILELDDKEFEILITHVLTALGFEESEHTGKTGDGGVDATGVLNVENIAKIKLFVQVKRYKKDARISASAVRALRGSIPKDGQGAFITTADFDKKSQDVALEPNFQRIGLVNGKQLVDILAEHWNDIPKEFQEKLNLKIGLVVN